MGSKQRALYPLMITLIENQRDALSALCRQHGVRRLDLFGSAASGSFDPHTSDLDFLVEFDDLPPGQYANAYFSLLESLEALFHRPIDLVMATAIKNPYFLESVNRTRTALYAA